MEQIKTFILKNRKDFLYIIGLLCLVIIFSILCWGYFGNLFYDCGREAYIPQVMLDGNILYKDIFAMYNPLSYQINAFLYCIFGASLNVLYVAGTINAFLIIVGIYLTTRLFIDRFYSFVFCLVLLSVYIFSSVTCINYIFPYAFAFPYALCGFIYFILFSMLYIKLDNPKFILPASIFLSFSIANKPEFVLSIIPFLCFILFKKEKFKYVLAAILGSLSVLLFSWGILFLQGLSFNEFIEYLRFINRFFETKEQQIFMQNTSFIWSIANWENVIFYFITTGLYLLIGSLYFNLFVKSKSKLKIVAWVLLPLFLIATVFYVSWVFIRGENIFSWCGIAVIFIFLLDFKNRNLENNQMRIMLSIFAFLSCFRVNLLLLQMSHSIYLSIIPLLVCWIYFISSQNKYILEFNIKRNISITLIFFSIINAFVLIKAKHVIYSKLQTAKGDIATVKSHVSVFKNSIDWINENTTVLDSVVMLPEGTMINFFTGRKTHNMYYHLIPNHIKAIGEDKIVNAFNHNKPDYFLLNNSNYSNYGADYICKDFGVRICGFINENYTLVKKFESGGNSNDYIYIEIYKLKNKQ